jgi:hypothetical protein
LSLHTFDIEGTWCRLFQKRGVCTNLNIFVLIYILVFRFIVITHWFESLSWNIHCCPHSCFVLCCDVRYDFPIKAMSKVYLCYNSNKTKLCLINKLICYILCQVGLNNIRIWAVIYMKSSPKNIKLLIHFDRNWLYLNGLTVSKGHCDKIEIL